MSDERQGSPAHPPGAAAPAGPGRERDPARRRITLGAALLRVAAALAVALLVALLALPLLSLFLRVTPAQVWARLRDPLVGDALRLSLVTALGSTVLISLLGLPVAYLLATRSFPGRRALEVVVELPMVLPPTVAGIALLLAFGRAGLLGRQLQLLGIQLPFSTLGVVVAQVFMAAPFFISAARAGFASVDRVYLETASTLRASEAYVFWRVMLPLSLPSLVAGATMSCARALAEFGATITFAGNLPGTTQTMPLAVYMAMQSDVEGAVVLAILLVLMSMALLLSLRWLHAGLLGLSGDAAR